MSGILKRRFEEKEGVEEGGPSPCMSLPASEDDEVSCGDSGNSSDSLNNHHAAPPAPRAPLSLQRQAKRARVAHSVHFESVTVYYFNRRQGFTSVPTQGGSSLGMSPRHSRVRRFTLREFATEQERSHQDRLRNHLKEEKLNATRLKMTKNGAVSLAEALTLDDISEDDLDLDCTEVDEYFFLQPLTTRRRRALLRASGVRRIDADEKHELRSLRVSREECGCHCRGACNPVTCACSLAGIKCQVDRMSFPCGCSKGGCSNTTGRLEFNPVRVRTHFLHTIMKLEVERSREQQQQQQQQPLVTNGNGYHGDSLLLAQHQQQPQNPQFPLMSGTPPHLPIMHLCDQADDSALCLGDEEEEEIEEEEEEEDEEEEDDDDDDDDDDATDDDDDDEAYGEDIEDEDGSSLCSGLSDCSTHSLETLNPEEEEEDEEEEGEEDWECSLDGASPPPYLHTDMVPLSSALGFSRSVHVDRNNPFHSNLSAESCRTDTSAFEPPACVAGPSLAATAALSLASQTAAEPPRAEPRRGQAETQGTGGYGSQRATESATLRTHSPVVKLDVNTALGDEIEEPQRFTHLQNNLNGNNEQQAVASAQPFEQAGEERSERPKATHKQFEQLGESLEDIEKESALLDQKTDLPCLETRDVLGL